MLLYVDSNFFSPYALVAFVSLLEKELQFDIEALELHAKANREPGFASTSISHGLTAASTIFSTSGQSPTWISPRCCSASSRTAIRCLSRWSTTPTCNGVDPACNNGSTTSVRAS